ncbi:MAG: PAS domain-containing sensor histidine kinase, partial [Anaerolineae bacterium]|nr:PAS domain-containing sensor histidine kinase [Anaerolineae bacterium]
RFPYRKRSNITRLRGIFDFGLSVFALVLLIIALLSKPFGSIFTGDSAYFLASLLVVLDIITVVLFLYRFLLIDINGVSYAMILSALGVISFLLADLIYAMFSVGNMPALNGMQSFGRLLGGSFIMLGALVEISRPLNFPEDLKKVFKEALFRLQTFFPLLASFLLAALVFFDNQANIIAFWGTLIMALGLIARQGVLVGEDEMQKYADLVYHIAEPTFICDSAGNFQLVNPALVNLAGYNSENELFGRSLLDLLDAPAIIKNSLIKQPEQGWSGEVNLKRTNGETIPIMLSLRLLSSSMARKLSIAGSAHDLSEQKQQQSALQQAYEQIAADRSALEEMNFQLEKLVGDKTRDLVEAYRQLEEQNRSLQQLDRLKSDFVGMVSHELRAPLTNIHGGIELLHRDSNLPAHMDDILQLVQAETRRLSRFVETILDLTALDAGHMPFYPAPILLQALVPTLQQLFTYRQGAERLLWNFPADLPFVLADDQAFTSIIFHLVDNAIKYAPDGNILISAGIQTDKRVWVQVSDEGPGISSEALSHLFQRFYRSNSDSQSVYGHGLGLYIVRRLLEAMNGDIEARNNSDRGVSFIFWLPVVDEKEVQDV